MTVAQRVWTVVELPKPMLGLITTAVVLMALIILLASFVIRHVRRRRRAALMVELDLTADESECLEALDLELGFLGIYIQDVPAWRRTRLERLGASMCLGLPGAVRENLNAVIKQTPSRAARIIDDEDEFRQWVHAEGLRRD